MDKAALLLLCCLVMSVSCSSLYPGVRPAQRASESSVLISSSTRDPSQTPGTESSARPRGQTEHRFGRHADAIFTNSYRKVLGQISARKFLQTIMGKRLGTGDARRYAKRQSDIFEDTIKQDLTTICREQKIKRWQLDANRPRSPCTERICRRSHDSRWLSGKSEELNHRVVPKKDGRTF